MYKMYDGGCSSHVQSHKKKKDRKIIPSINPFVSSWPHSPAEPSQRDLTAFLPSSRPWGKPMLNEQPALHHLPTRPATYHTGSPRKRFSFLLDRPFEPREGTRSAPGTFEELNNSLKRRGEVGSWLCEFGWFSKKKRQGGQTACR